MDLNRLSFYLYRFPQLTKFEKTKVMEKQKTAVEWLEEQLWFIVSPDLFDQAKQMEKEQIIDAFEFSEGSTIQRIVQEMEGIIQYAEQYYESKYGKDEDKAENND